MSSVTPSSERDLSSPSSSGVVTVWLDLVRTHLIHTDWTQAQPDDNALQLSSIKVEASGLFLLCSSSLALRKLESKPSKRLANLTALPLYRHYLSGTRAYSLLDLRQHTGIQLLEHDATDSEVTAIRALPSTGFTTTDRSRLDAVTHAGKEKLLLCIIEGDQSKSHSLWLAVLPYFVEKLAQAARFGSGVAHFRHHGCLADSRLRCTRRDAEFGNGWAGPQASAGGAWCRGSTNSDGYSGVGGPVAGVHDRSGRHGSRSIDFAHFTPRTADQGRHHPHTRHTIGTAALFYYLATLLAWEDPRFRDVANLRSRCHWTGACTATSGHPVATARRLSDGIKLGSGMQTHNHTRRGGPLRASQNHCGRRCRTSSVSLHRSCSIRDRQITCTTYPRLSPLSRSRSRCSRTIRSRRTSICNPSVGHSAWSSSNSPMRSASSTRLSGSSAPKPAARSSRYATSGHPGSQA